MHTSHIPASEESALAAAQTLVDAFARHDTTAYFAAFAPEASFVFHSHPTLLPTRAAYQQLWSGWEQDHGFRVLGCKSSDPRVQVWGDTAVFTHHVHTRLQMGGENLELRERETIVFRHAAATGWLAVHEHLSPIADPESSQG